MTRNGLRLGIEGSNLREGGGVSHLVQLLADANPARHGISRVVVWGNQRLISQAPKRDWLDPVHEPLLDGSLPTRMYWSARVLPKLAARSCDVLFSPGGGYVGSVRPFVTMFRNALPFSPDERRRYGMSRMRIRLLALRRIQDRSMSNAAGVIFLNQYARDLVGGAFGDGRVRSVVVPHGVDDRFRRMPRPQRAISACSPERPFRLLYVSKIDVYKHQWAVAEAVTRLRRSGIAVTLDLVGPAYGPALRRLLHTLRRHDPLGDTVTYHGEVAPEDLAARYHGADAFVFASTCENLPNVLVEAMAAGLPIVCMRRPPMAEMLAEACAFFDDERPVTIATALAGFMKDETRRGVCAHLAYQRAQEYSWTRCADQTLAFLASVAASRPELEA
jgi:glycosyltransferase involved in cell wall biosynthesis